MPALTDIDYLNFALNLEYLEAEFYLRAVTGAGLSPTDVGAGAGTVVGGNKVTFTTPALSAYATEMANDHQAHVRFLRSALGASAVARPAIDFTNSFNAVAVAAGIVPAGGTFNPFADGSSFIVGAFLFEDIGVSAYHGLSTLLIAPANLATIAGLMAAEAYHAATIRTLLSYLGDPYLTYANQLAAIRPSSSTGREQGVSGSTIVPADANSVSFARSPDQMLRIGYLNGAPGLKGGFFPAGMNGSISPLAGPASPVADSDMLNFLLNIEYLEAQFYTLATQGRTIDQLGIGVAGTGIQGGVTTKGSNNFVSCLVPFTTPLLQQFATELALEERNHVTFLRTALGAAAIATPALDLFNSFNQLAIAAKIVPPGGTFDPFGNEVNFLLGAFLFEDLGVTAYRGALASLTTKTYIDKVAGILAVEAYHAGSIRSRIYGSGSTAQASSQAIASLRATLDGSNKDDVGVGTSASGASTILDADANALVFTRTASQVLSVFYSVPSGKAAFFPSGLNGNIK